MIVVMRPEATKEQIQNVITRITDKGLSAHSIDGVINTVLGVVGDTVKVDKNQFSILDGVDKIITVNEPFKLANRKMHPENTIVNVQGVEIGGKKITVMAGPCSIETNEQITFVAGEVKKSGAKILRGGAYKPRSSPYSFQGLKEEGLAMMEHAAKTHNLPMVTEILDPRHVEMFEGKVAMMQIGARNMQNFELLKEVGKSKTPVLLKRSFSATIDEWLMAAEYIMSEGNENVVLCERGIRTFSKYTRNTLDLSVIPVVKKLSHLPVVVDPSHACGKSYMIESMSLAAVAAGADGLIIEVHNDPQNAWCDGAQSVTPEQFATIMQKLRVIANVVGRDL